MAVIRINNTLEDKGVLIAPEHFDQVFDIEIKPKANTDWYASLFTFGDEAKEYFETQKGSIKGYNGPAYTNNIVFDLDNKEDLEKARQDTIKLLTRLAKEIGLNKEGIHKHVRVYFSGHKGFHVFIKTTEQFTPEELKEYCKIIAGDLSSFDTSIYNRTRCFRIANTINPKSGLYKIPVSLELIKDKEAISKIKELAKTPYDLPDNTIPLSDLTLINNYVQLKRNIKQNTITSTVHTEEIEGIRGLTKIDFKKGKGIPKCIYALSQGVAVPGKGHRHEVFLHLGNYYRNQGHNKIVVENILSGIAELNSNLYPEYERFSDYEIKNSVSKMVFADDNKINIGGWGVTPDNEIFASYCKHIPGEDKCSIHSKSAKKAIVTVDNMALDFAGFASDFESNVIPTGIGFIDDKMKIAKGTTTLLVGGSGVGKTSILLSSFEQCHKNNVASVFFSMDMHKNLLFMRLAQRYTNYTSNDIFNIYRTHDIKKIQEINEIIKDHFGSTYFDFTGNLTIDDIVHRVELIEQENSVDVKLVAIDYASRLSGPHSDTNANEGYNALKSKDAADQTDAAWIILNQVSRASGDGSTPLRSKRVAKGSSAWEESASNVLTVWRPFMAMDGHIDEDGVEYKDDYMRILIAKNRMGEEKETVVKWLGAKGTIQELSEQELYDYDKNIKPLEKKVQKAKKFNFGG